MDDVVNRMAKELSDAIAAAVAEDAGTGLPGIAHSLLPLHRIDMPSVLHCVPFLAILQ